MGDRTRIEWTDATWNPVTGCTPVSEGCAHCYARRIAQHRLAGRHGYPQEDPFAVTVHKNRLNAPFHWRNPRMVFVCSMGDLFHDDVPIRIQMAVWWRMFRTPQHIYQLLTKRPKQMRRFLACLDPRIDKKPLPNLWLGVSTENQKTFDERAALLLRCPAAVRFISCEPLLGPIDFGDVLVDGQDLRSAGRGPSIDWVIAGGETGPGARPMKSEWARSIRDQCQAAEVPFFFKRWGSAAGRDSDLRLLDGKIWDEMP